jgi:hypothetical protein
MNRRLSEARIRATCRELIAMRGHISGRTLCAELRKRFDAVGKTTRVFQIWREESLVQNGMPLDADVADLRRRLTAAETAAAENLARAERAEYRELAHQDKWAAEIDRLRQELKAARGGR